MSFSLPQSKLSQIPRHFSIGEHVELQSPAIPLDFQGISAAFQAGVRGCLTRISTTIFCVCCCRKINGENSSVEVVNDEGSLAVTMFPDDCCIFELAVGTLYPLCEYSAFGFKLGDVISDPYQSYRLRADGWDPACELSRSRARRFPSESDEDASVITRICNPRASDPPGRIPPLSQQYADLPSDSKVFKPYCRARQTSVYVGGWVRKPEVGQLVARFSAVACHLLAVIVYVGEDYLILRDSIDYAARRIRCRWGMNPGYAEEYVDCVLKIRRLDWWMTSNCKCVPMLPHLQDRDWEQWSYSDLLHLSDGT